MTHSIFLIEDIPYCSYNIAQFNEIDCWFEWDKPDCMSYIPHEPIDKITGHRLLNPRCDRIKWKTRVISKQYKHFEYDEREGITLGNALHPIDQIKSLIIDGKYYIGGPEVEG